MNDNANILWYFQNIDKEKSFMFAYVLFYELVNRDYFA